MLLCPNADVLLVKLQDSGFIDLTEYSLSNIKQENWNSAIREIAEISSRIRKAGEAPQVQIREDILICDTSALNAYTTALFADFIRYMLVELWHFPNT